MSPRNPFLAVLLAAGALPFTAIARPEPATLKTALEQQTRPMVVFVTGKAVAKPWGVAEGVADPASDRPVTVDTPFRIASNTKTFVAVTILRLWEQGRIDLDAPISPLITPALDRLLRSDGYDTGTITVRQLLSHSAGLYDHGGDPRYIKTVLADPRHRWTREEQVRLAIDYADPVARPGAEFRYSDTDYILLGDIIERLTGEPLAKVVRRELRFDRLGLKSTWWEIAEPQPKGTEPRAHQFLGSVDATGVDASMDLYGGGGLIMSARDLATFAAALFEGRIFDRPATLREMLWQGPHQGADKYRLGIFVKRAGGRDLYWHSGFWGTVVYYSPDAGVAIAGFTTNQDAARALLALVERTAADATGGK